MTDIPPRPGDDAVRRSRYPLRGYPVTALLVAAIVTLAILLAVKGRTADAGAPPQASASPTPTGDVPSPLAAAPDHGTVRVADSGFENIRDIAGERQVTWGAILENTSGAATAAARLWLTFRDAQGAQIRTEDFYRRASVPTILPGRRAGIGDVAYIHSRVSTVTVRVTAVQWWPRSGHAKPQTLTVSHVTTAWKDQGESVPYWGAGKLGAYRNRRGDLYVMFRVDSTYRTLLTSTGATAVFRNAHGAIIGGAPIDDFGYDQEFPPGWSDHYIKVKYGPPDDIAEGSTEVYAYWSNDQYGY